MSLLTLFLPSLYGFLLGASLIIAIGAQNAYILRMGLLRHHVFWLCLFCAASDAVLIILGVAGLGAIVEAYPGLLRLVSLAGALFLAVYALIAWWRSQNPQAMEISQQGRPHLLKALGTVAAFTWLNPHVYLDTVILIGAYAAQYGGAERIAYGLGAVVASFTWFFGLGYGARFLAPLFTKASAWKFLEIMIAIIMALLALALLRQALL